MVIDVSWIGEGMPFFAFALIFVVSYAILAKTKVLGGQKWTDILTSLIFAVIFVSFSSVQKFLVNVTVWFSVLLAIIFFFLLITFFIVKEPDKLTKPLGIIFLILLGLIAISAIFYTFPSARAILPGVESENSFIDNFKDFLAQEKIYSAIILIVLALVVGFIITR